MRNFIASTIYYIKTRQNAQDKTNGDVVNHNLHYINKIIYILL